MIYILSGFDNSKHLFHQCVEMMEASMEDVVSHFMAQVKLEDLLNIGFMKPVEMALRNHQNDKEVPTDALPQGMLYAHKAGSIEDNRYTLHPLQEVDQEASLEQLRLRHQNNYLSLLKKPRGTELAICVCMYSEDKPMLKRTLEGIADNIDLLVEKGSAPDDIYVAIVIDGIQKVDPSLFTYFEEFERESQIFLEEDDDNSMRKKYEMSFVNTEIEEHTNLNYSKYLFMEEEFQDRVSRKFVSVRQRYDKVVKMRNQIQTIKKEKSSSSQNLKMIINKIIDQQKGALRAMADSEEELDEAQFEITEQTIMSELAAAEEECNQYIAAREDLAYISAYRLPTRSLSQTVAGREDAEQEKRGQSWGRSRDDSGGELAQDLLDRSNPVRTSTGQQQQQQQLPSRRNKKYVNLLFCIKYKNSGKLSSHNWFFNGICNQLKPKYSILLDVGLRPYPESLYKMYHYMRRRPHIGGVCGYMSLKAEKVEDEEMHKEEDLDWLSSFCLNFVDIQKAQQIQYHFAHLIDKPFESIFKFIHVLPGAFSGYSMEALRPVDRKDALLREYFKSIDEKLKTNKVVPSNFTASDILMRVFLPKIIWSCFRPVDPDSEEQVLYNENIYLAEDRILCMGIHKNEKDIIFMPDAYAEVDPIKTVNGLMGQRKRWINGSNFAFEKVQREMKKNQSPKMAVADFFLKMQIFYLNLSNLLVYLAPALLLFTFHLTMQTIRQQYLIDVFAITDATGIGSVIYATFVNTMDFLYALMFFGVVFFSIHLTHSNKRYIYYIYFFSTIYGVFSFTTFIVIIIDIAKGFSGLDSFIENEYEARLDEALAGAGSFVNLMRYFILSSMLFYIFPLAIYGIFFFRVKYLWEIVSGTFSFIFYSPSYLNLLNIYALCRIDDISWGTKGLDAEVGGKNAGLKETWKIVKMIDVAKFFLWNIIIGTLFIVFDSYLLIKFFLTLSLLMLFSAIQAIKMVIGMVYLIKYKFITAKKNKADRETPLATVKHEGAEDQDEDEETSPLQKDETYMHIYKVVDSFEKSIKEEVKYSFMIAASEQAEKDEAEEQEAAKERAPSAAVEMKGRFTRMIDGEEKMLPRSSRVSRQVMQAFLSNKFQNIRKSNELRKDYYPDGKGAGAAAVAARMMKDEGGEEDGNIEVHLLQRRLEKDVVKGQEGRGGSKNYDKIRQTFMNMQSKKYV